jgi:hypothetical protein
LKIAKHWRLIQAAWDKLMEVSSVSLESTTGKWERLLTFRRRNPSTTMDSHPEAGARGDAAGRESLKSLPAKKNALEAVTSKALF